MMLFWGEGFLRRFTRIVLLVGAALFLWGWISHVAMGRMTTGQYVHKLCADFQQGVKNGSENIIKIKNRIFGDVEGLYNGPGKADRKAVQVAM